MSHQVVGIHVAVHADVGTSGRKVANDTARARPEVFERVLSVDAALYCMPLQQHLRLSTLELMGHNC